MDFDVNTRQRELLATLAALAASVSRRPRGDVGGVLADACDPELERRLGEAMMVDHRVDLLDRVLLVEEAVRLGVPINASATLLLRAIIGPSIPPGPLGVRAVPGDSPLRFGRDAVGVIDVCGDTPTFAETRPDHFRPVVSGTVAGYGVVASGPAVELPWKSELAPLVVHQLGRAAEVAGAARRAVELTASYLRQRRQFGRTLSSFQALQHRLAELAVDAEAASTLVRMAAYTGSTASVRGAASYAVAVAARAVPELHQLTGARGFTFESGLPAFTLHLVASRAELISSGVSPCAYADEIWA